MAKFVNDNMMDALLDRVILNANSIVLCEGQPVNRNEAITDLGTTVPGGGTARALGENAITSADFTGPQAGDSNGRKYIKNQETGLNIDVTSTNADHVAIVTSTTALSELLLVTTITSPQPVTSGNTATINAFDHEVADPT